MNIKDSYLHSGTHLVKNISFAASGGVIKATITWAQEGVDATELTLPTMGGASFGSQTANYVLAAPDGSAGTPTFRELVAADIPVLDANKITTGTIAHSLLPLATTSTKGAVFLGIAKTSDADSAITGKKYWVKMNANGKLFVDIPWTDTTYKLTVNGTTNGSGNTSLGTLYAVATSDATAEDQVWMRNGDNTAYAWRALGSRAFDSTSYIPLAGNSTTSPITGTLYIKDTDGIYIRSDNLDKNIWHISKSWDSQYGFNLQYLGTQSGNNNDLILWAHAQTGTHVEVYRVHQDGSFIFKSTPKVGTTSVSLEGHKHAYTDLTGSTTTANQAIVSNGTANGWTLKTLGSRAFDSTSYLPLSGGTMTGPINASSDDTIDTTKAGINFGTVGRIGANATGLGIYSTSKIFIRPNQTISNSLFTYTDGIELTSTTFTYNGNTVYHSGNIPSNSKDTAGIVPKGVASRVYMTDSTGAPSWTQYDTTVTSGSSHLVTSGAVYTAIANNVAGAVQYQGTIDSEADMIALTGAGQGDFARVTTAFTFTDATGASVTAHVGDVVYLTNNTPGTSSNWIVAHTEIDTDTWTAASTSAAGYIPKLVTGGTTLASSSDDYVLSFVHGTDTTPVWKKLPSNAYANSNTWRGIYVNNTNTIATSTSSKALNYKAGSNVTITYKAAGTSTGQSGSTKYFNIEISATDTTYKLKLNNTDKGTTGGTDLGTIYAPTSAGTGFLKGTAGEDGAITWSWDNSTYNNYVLPKSTTSALGGIIVSNVLTSAVTLTSGNGSTASRYYGVQLDNDGKAFVNIPWTDTKVDFDSKSDNVSYYIPFKSGTTAQAEQLYFNSGITINPSTKTITATTFSGALSGNASTASNLSKTDGRGYLYQSDNTTTGYTGVGSVSDTSEIGLPYIGYNGSANTYGIYKDLFYLSGTTKYIGNDVHSNKFACVKSKDSTTDDWTGSSTSGSESGSGTNTYTAGPGININNNGVISTTRKEWYGTEAQFNSLPSLDSDTTYYITN